MNTPRPLITFFRDRDQCWHVPGEADSVLVSIEANGHQYRFYFGDVPTRASSVRLIMPNDAYPALEIVPELFRALALGQPDTLDGVDRLLGALGYERERKWESPEQSKQ